MKVIEKINVVVQSTSEGFHDALVKSTQRFQGWGLEVTINNPHLVRLAGKNKYVAVVEGCRTLNLKQ